jgi:hypothetical protein
MSIDMRMLSGDEVVALARRILTVRPLLGRVAPEQIMAELGWPELPGGSAFAKFCDPGLGFGEAAIGLLPDGAAKTVVVPIHSVLPRPSTQELDDFRQDAFSVAGRALTAAFGRAYALQDGNSPRLKWRVGESVLTTAREKLGVRVYLWRAEDLEDAE